MSTFWMTLFFCLCCFICWFAYSYGAWKEKAISGEPFEISGKVYRIIEVDINDENLTNK